jgi:hypothetical protein
LLIEQHYKYHFIRCLKPFPRHVNCQDKRILEEGTINKNELIIHKKLKQIMKSGLVLFPFSLVSANFMSVDRSNHDEPLNTCKCHEAHKRTVENKIQINFH